jgi:hypothetical protein
LFGGGGGEYGSAGGSGTVDPSHKHTGVCGTTWKADGNRYSSGSCPDNCNDPSGINFHEGDGVDGYPPTSDGNGISFGMSGNHGFVIIQNYQFDDSGSYACSMPGNPHECDGGGFGNCCSGGG